MRVQTTFIAEFIACLFRFAEVVGFTYQDRKNTDLDDQVIARYCQHPLDTLVGVEFLYEVSGQTIRWARLYVQPDFSFEWAGFMSSAPDGRPKQFEAEGHFTPELGNTPAPAANQLGLQILDWILSGKIPQEPVGAPGMLYNHLTYTPNQD